MNLIQMIQTIKFNECGQKSKGSGGQSLSNP